MKPEAHILHQSSGRTRLKVPEKRGDADYFAQSIKLLSDTPGINSVRTNPLTASILLLHPDTPSEKLETQLNQSDLFEIAEQPSHEPPISLFNTKIEEIETTVREWSWDRHTALFVLFAVLGLRQLLRGEIMAPAIPMLIYALEFAFQKYPANQPPSP